MTLKFTDYAKIEQMKNLILEHLDSMGLSDQVRAMNDADLEKIMLLMGLMGDQIKQKNNDEERMELMMSYIICLWTRLIVDYGAELREL